MLSVLHSVTSMLKLIVGCSSSFLLATMANSKPARGRDSRSSYASPEIVFDPLIIPSWWPLDHQGRAVRSVFRTMRTDLDDLRWEPHLVHTLDIMSTEFAEVAMHSVTKGSAKRSPFLHVSLTFEGARRFAQLAQKRVRKESPDQQMMVKIHIYDWWLAGEISPIEMPEHGVIDVSCHKAWAKILPDALDNSKFLTDSHTDAVWKTSHSKELLIKWRGKVPHMFMEVIDSVTGNISHGRLGAFLVSAKEPGTSHVSISRALSAQQASKHAQPRGLPPGSTDRQAPQTPAASSNSQSSVENTCVRPSRPCHLIPDVDEGEGQKSSRTKIQTQVKKTVEENTEGVKGSGKGVEEKTASTPGVHSSKRSATCSASRAVVPNTSSGQKKKKLHATASFRHRCRYGSGDFLEPDDDDEPSPITMGPAISASNQLAEPVSTQIGDEDQQVSAGSRTFDEATALTASSSTASSSGNVAYSYILALFPYTYP